MTALGQADYPLIDPPLIIAIISDYDIATVETHLEEIRDQLGILEATLVPDPNDVRSGAPIDTEKIVVLAESEGGQSSKSESHSAKSEHHAASLLLPGYGQTRETNTSASASGNGASGKSTSPTSVVDDEQGYTDELELLAALFPGL